MLLPLNEGIYTTEDNIVTRVLQAYVLRRKHTYYEGSILAAAVHALIA